MEEERTKIRDTLKDWIDIGGTLAVTVDMRSFYWDNDIACLHMYVRVL